MTTTRDLLLASTLIAVTGCGDDRALICAPGTFEADGSCLAIDPDDTTAPTTTADAAGGRGRTPVPERVTLTTDEPATIYVTTDGSEPDIAAGGEPSPVLVPDVASGTTLRFFAVDAAGNREATKTLSFDYDATGPARPGLALTLTGADASLTITPPADADYAGTILARVTGEFDAVPEVGVTYAAGQELSENVRIVTAGATTTFADPGRAPGVVTYVAWSYDDLGNYGAPRIVTGQVDVGSLIGRVSIDAATGTATVPTQLANVPLTVAVSGTGTLTVDLTLTNQTTRTFQAPKLAFTSVTGGTLQGTDGMLDGTPVRAFGPNALVPGAAITRSVTLTGVAPDATVVLDVELRDSPLLVFASRPDEATVGLVDGTMFPEFGKTTTEMPVRGANGRSAPRSSCGSVDGRYLFVGNQHFGRVERLDLGTRMLAGGVLGASSPGYVADVLCDGQGTVYAVLAGGGRRNRGSALSTAGAKYQIVRYTEGLVETGRGAFDAESAQGMANPALSPDGSVIAIPARGRVVLIDTDTLSEIPTSVAGVGPYLATDFSDKGIRHVRWSPDGQRLYAQSWWSRGFARFDFTGPVRAGVATRTIVDASSACCDRNGDIEVMPDGKVWDAGDNRSLRIYDPATNQFTSTGAGSGRGLERIGDEVFMVTGDRALIRVLDTAGAFKRQFAIQFSANGHRLGATR